MATPRGPWQPDNGGAQRTVWVEGLPDTVASEQAVRSVLRAGGGSVVSVHVGKQPGTSASCALCLFLHASEAQRACDDAAARPAGWQMTLFQQLDAEQVRPEPRGAGHRHGRQPWHGRGTLVDRPRLGEHSAVAATNGAQSHGAATSRGC